MVSRDASPHLSIAIFLLSQSIHTMSSLKEIAKGGWHPKGKDGGEESWRSDFKGINQVVCLSASRSARIWLTVTGGMDGKGKRHEQYRSA